MLSGVGPKDHLHRFGIECILDLPVGNNFKIHALIFNISRSPPIISRNNLEQLYFRSTGPLTVVPHIALFFNTKSNPDPKWPNVFTWAFIGANDKIMLFPMLALTKSNGTVRLQ